MIGPFEINRPAFGDALELAKQLPDESIQCIVTSPPYWGLRDYGVDGQMGLEETPEAYIEKMVALFRELRRALRKDGTAWVNLGDSYASSSTTQTTPKARGGRFGCSGGQGRTESFCDDITITEKPGLPHSCKPKDLVGIPWRFAFAAQADGWYLRSDIIWAKPNPMPESVTDRPTKAHEYLFLLAKSERYYYDADAVREGFTENPVGWIKSGCGVTTYGVDGQAKPGDEKKPSSNLGGRPNSAGRNRRTVWTIPTQPYSEAHFATFPPNLIKPCILAGCPEGGLVLDPFLGSGTTGRVCQDLGRNWIGFELNKEYEPLINKRIAQQGLF